METRVEMKEPRETVSASNASDARLKTLPRLRGGDSCREHCYTIICLAVVMTIGFTILATGGANYAIDNSNIAARNATIAGAVIFGIGVLCYIGALYKACVDGTYHGCGCYFICC